MAECPICRREFEDEFSVFVPPHPEGFDSIDCAQKAALIWGATAAAATAPIVLPTIEVVPPPPPVQATPVPITPGARRGLAALAALALVPTQVALAGGVGLAAAGTAASVYLAAKPVLQAPPPVAVATTPAVEPAKPPSASGSGTSSGSATTSSSGTGSAPAPAPRARHVAPLKPAARRSVVVSTRPTHRIKIAAKAHAARPHVKPETPSPHATTSTAEFASQPVRVTHPHTSTPPPKPKRASHPKPKPDPAPKKPHAPAKPHPPGKPQPPTSTPAPATPTTTTPTISSTRVVASVEDAPPKKKKKKQQPPQPPPTQPQADPAPPANQTPDVGQSPAAPPCGDDTSKPGNGYGDKNHEHSGPPGQEDKSSNPNKGHGDDNGHGNGNGNGKGKGH